MAGYPEILDYGGVAWTGYLKEGGRTGIVNYSLGSDFIWIEFVGHLVYLYNREVTGEHIDEMKRLAVKNEGLSSYISRHRKEVHERYAAAYQLSGGVYKKIKE